MTDDQHEGDRGGLYVAGPASGARAPILLTHFDGAMDAGAAGSLAVMQMLRTLGGERVATFDADQLIDYRSHRPVMTVEDWVTTGVETPEIALDLVHDDMGRPVLLLHGPEPDAKWEAFAQTVAELAHDAGVEISFSIHGIPAGVPHTRPTPVHVQATDPSLVPDQPQMAGTMQFPAPLSAFLQERLSTTGIEGASLLAAVPYYMADNAYPRAASALLGKLSDLGDLSLPVGDLERGATEDIAQVSALVEGNPEVERTVQALERHYDAMAEGGSSPSISDGDWEDSEDRDIGDVIEAYLANQSKRAAAHPDAADPDAAHPGPDAPATGADGTRATPDGPDAEPTPRPADGHGTPPDGDSDDSDAADDEDGADGPRESVQDVLDRLANRHRSSDERAPGTRRPRHRADDQWEMPRND